MAGRECNSLESFLFRQFIRAKWTAQVTSGDVSAGNAGEPGATPG